MRSSTAAWILLLGVGWQHAVRAESLPLPEETIADTRPRETGDQLKDSVGLAPAPEKNYWLPALEVAGVNLGVWSYNRYLSKEGWSNISWNTIKRNFRTGLVWDVDGYLNNQFLHPYHGATYYSTARTNGLTFWESAPYAFGGSLMWEYFMEDQPPSYNDIVNTPVTGIILGEISLRVSEVIIDESAVGVERFLRETGALVVNPVNGVNRLLRGDMWKQGRSREHPDFSLAFSAGINEVFFSRRLSGNTVYGFVSVDFGLGDPLAVSQHDDPFDYFVVHSELSIARGDNIAGIFASGVLWDTNLKVTGASRGVAGLYKEVDILINTVYKLSATSLTGQWIDRRALSSGVMMQTVLSVSAILMGATNSRYASEFGKDYNIGPGASAKIGVDVHVQPSTSVRVSYKRYWIHTLSGAAGEEFVGLFKVGTSRNLNSFLDLGVDLLLYERYGDYKHFPDTQTANSALRLYAQFRV